MRTQFLSAYLWGGVKIITVHKPLSTLSHFFLQMNRSRTTAMDTCEGGLGMTTVYKLLCHMVKKLSNNETETLAFINFNPFKFNPSKEPIEFDHKSL